MHEHKTRRANWKLLFLTFAFPALLLQFPPSARAQLTTTGGEITVPYSGTTATILSANTPAANLNITSGTNTFLLSVNPVQNSVRLYVQNDTANSCANLQILIASTGNNNVTSFNSNVGAWQAVSTAIGTGGFSTTTQTFTLPATSTVAITTAPIIGGRIAVQLVLNPANSCATTNLEAQAVFGVFTVPTSQVQGTVATGLNGAAVNPLVCGGLDTSNLVRPCGMYRSSDSLINELPGLAIGQAGSTLTGNTQQVFPKNQGSGPLAVNISATTAAGGTNTSTLRTANGGGQIQCGSGNGFTCGGLLISDSGFINNTGAQVVTTSTTFSLSRNDIGFGSEVQYCRLDFQTTGGSGTAPTLDVYFQDSPDGVNFTDRVHFAQVTTTGSATRAWATLSATAGTSTPTLYTNQTLAANTQVNGAMGNYFRVAYVTGGTTPQWNGVQFTMNCK